MARENQGLQIALIIFVMLTIILGVTTFIFFNQYQEATVAAKTATDKANTERDAAANVQTENNDFKKYMGFDPGDDKETVSKGFNDDMQVYAAAATVESLASYRAALEKLHEMLKEKNAALAKAQSDNRDWEVKYNQIERIAQQQIEPHKQQLAATIIDRDQQHETFNRERAEFTTKTGEIQKTLDESHAKADKAMDELRAALDGADKRLRTLNDALNETTETIRELHKPVFDVPDGKVRWVNQGAGTVWINLGRADQLPLQLSFAVYDAGATDVSTAGKKGSVEVTQLLGDHLAEARIVEDDMADPILPGDIIHTPIWAPGEKEHFGLTDGMDIDGDGKSDLAQVRNIITAAGGEIDVWLDDKGVRNGRLQTKTRYLVVGTEHNVNTPPDVIEARTNLLRQADELGVRTITLKDLLNKMGYKRQNPVVRYGAAANPADFRARPPEGGVRRSTGNVSEGFRERRPGGGVQPRSAFD
jgi:hypothetical protein